MFSNYSKYQVTLFLSWNMVYISQYKAFGNVVGIEHYVESIQYNVSGDKCPEKVVGNKFQ